MGYRPIRSAADACAHGFFLEVTCAGCGRVAVFDPGGFALTKLYHGPIERLAGRLVCQGGPGGPAGCGRRGAQVRFVTWPPTPPVREMPKPVATPAPRGIDQDEWDRADERDRKRLIQRARG